MPLALRRRLAVAAAVLAFLALGAAYARAVPPWEAPDEPWHAAYAMAVADGRLPSAAETYEFHHPPLAYAWSALGIRIARIRPGGLAVGEANPRYPFAAAALAHPPGDPRVGRVRFLRAWGALLAALAVAMTFAAARAARLAGSGGVAAAFVLATWPQFVFTGHTVSNDGLATVAGAALLYAVVRMPAGRVARRAEGPRPRRAVRADPAPNAGGGVNGGASAGALPQHWGRDRPAKPARAGARAGLIAFAGAAVAVTTKLNAAVLVPVVVAAALGVAAASRDPRRRAAGAWTAFGAIAGSIGGLAVLGVVAPSAIAALGAQALVRAGGPAATLPTSFVADTLASVWARFGWANVDLPPVLLVPVGVIVGVVVFIGLPLAVRRRRRGDVAVSATALVGALALAAASVIAFGASALADPQPQGRLLLPALPALALLLAAGWASLPSTAWRRAAGGAAVAVVALSHAAALGIVLPRAYAPAPPEPGALVVRHLPAPWRIVATVAGGASVAKPSTAADDDLRRVEVPIVVRTAGTLHLTVTRRGANADADEDEIGSAAVAVEVTRPRPWFGEARVRPVWVGVDMETVPDVRAGDGFTLTVGASDGAVVELWGGDAGGDDALVGGERNGAELSAPTIGAGTAGGAVATSLMRIEVYSRQGAARGAWGADGLRPSPAAPFPQVWGKGGSRVAVAGKHEESRRRC